MCKWTTVWALEHGGLEKNPAFWAHRVKSLVGQTQVGPHRLLEHVRDVMALKRAQARENEVERCTGTVHI
eukprot:CAMPEP_0115354042 /NCGR_PEP_ID=MMETSP0270-20121206/98369_1 /TAXON_ID=71861 /ORGANISM="Scrippsiella trochoidea, Strain CCMP3099" /LENGTH=69 /DNA_ID=CAMNT_0002776337 /DNA_START=46 /DNA_END=255 /DNA_ORIENTATION=+